MEISIFDVLGPVMIGPSSSHTAGAARLARVARLICGKPFRRVTFGLHGSFAHTSVGHGTDRALVAGILGLRESDERLRNSFELAAEQGITFDFYALELDNVPSNSVKISFYCTDEQVCTVIGSSVGGGQIMISEIDGFATEIDGLRPTIVIGQQDIPGVVSGISAVLTKHGQNIAIMKVSRKTRGDAATCMLQTDSNIPELVGEELRQVAGVQSVRIINL